MADTSRSLPRRRWLWWAAIPAVLLAVLLAFGTLFAGAEQPTEFVELRLVEKELIEERDGERLYSMRFEDPLGTSVDAYLREPAREELPPQGLPAVVLVAGRHTGRDAAAVIPGPLETVILAVEYPQTIPPRLTLSGWMRTLPAIRRSALRMPGILSGAAHWLAAEPQVNPARIGLVGVSFGVPFATVAGKDPIFQGVALHYGGADLANLLRANLPIENGWMRGALARFGGFWFREMEPARHVGAIAPTPLLLINATMDDQIPRESAMRLAGRAKPPMRHIWLPYGHLDSGQTEVMREVADSTFRWFGFQQE